MKQSDIIRDIKLSGVQRAIERLVKKYNVSMTQWNCKELPSPLRCLIKERDCLLDHEDQGKRIT